MIRVLACCLLVALSCAEEAQPSTLETSFVGLFGNAQNLATQELFQRRLADITLGMQVAQGFSSFAAFEFQKFNPSAARSVNNFEEQESLQRNEARSFAKGRRELEEASPSKEELEARELEEMGSEFLQLKMTEESVNLEQMSTNAKNMALKSLHLQLYLTGSDVEKSYWLSKFFATVLPPQLSTFKLYKSYLNTIALSTAYQFHDAYTFESLIDDFNDKFDASTLITEAHAEANVYRNWYTLAMIKWQLFMLSMYEQSMGMGAAANANANANAAHSFLETESQEQFFSMGGNGMMSQYAYMVYYVMMLKYSSLISELMLAQAGWTAADLKVRVASATSIDGIPEDSAHRLDELEGKTLPHLYSQWAQTNQIKYMMEYYMLMMDMQSPAYALSQSTKRAEESFLNLFQTQNAETTPAAPAAAAAPSN